MARAARRARKKPPPAWLRLGPPTWLQHKTAALSARRRRPPNGWIRIVFVQKTAQQQRVKLQYEPQGGKPTSIVLAYAAAKAKLAGK
jgi:hypothetical protein